MTVRKSVKGWASVTLVAMSLFLFASLASAHVTVRPEEVPANSYQVFTVRVPSETKGVNTVRVELKTAEGAVVSRVEPKPGWKHEIEKAADGSVASVTWTSEGSGLAETEFTEFRVSGKVAEDAKELVWRAYQTYSDNSVAEWTGGADSDKPASVTKVTAADAGGGDGHGGQAAQAEESGDKESSNSTLPLVLSIIGVVLGAAALVVSATKKKK
ncbi:YcnI family protein [Paenibacillus sp. NPDC058071]|uniref:YcnI family copper-binding membrane protein n=1 Tax=Paenibacillus sp. NPDC058071 TaxID=3346326 RepID=UPI0036DE05B7